MKLQPGSQLRNGQYTILRELGRGGFGFTYLVEDKDEKLFTLKLLYSHIKESYLTQEVRALLECRQHSNIVKFDCIFTDFFGDSDRCCLVMEYVEGETFWEHLEKRERGRLTQEEAIRYIQQVGNAVGFAHEKGLLHRDINPNNIIWRYCDSQAILIDFGIARELTSDSGAPVSRSHTPKFAPIEQVTPEKGIRKPGKYTDIYALAATLYVFLTGKSGHGALPTAEERFDKKKLLLSPKEFNQSISDEVVEVILWGMEIEPQDRPQFVSEWLERLPNFTPQFSRLSQAQPTHFQTQQNSESRSQSSPQPSLPFPQPDSWLNVEQTYDIAAHLKSVHAVAFSPDDRIIASASGDCTIKLWNAETGQFSNELNHQDAVFCVSISSDSKTIASGDGGYKVKVWNLETKKLRFPLNGHFGQILSIAISPNSKVLVSGSILGKIITWSLETGAKIREFGTSFKQDTSILYDNPIVIHPDGQMLINGVINSRVDLWDLHTGQNIRSCDPHLPVYWQHSVNSVAFSSALNVVVSNCDRVIEVWDFDSGEMLYKLPGHRGKVYCLAISPDGKVLASGSEDCTIKLWNLETRQLINTIDEHKEAVYSVAFASDGRRLASGSRDRTIKMWQIS